MPTFIGTAGDDTLIGGDGNDTFTWALGDGSDRVDGGTGDDTLSLTAGAGADNISLSASGTGALVAVNGATAADTTSVEIFSIKPLGGADVVQVGDLGATAVTFLTLDLSGADGLGDGAADSVTLNGSAGNDQLTVSDGASTLQVSGTLGGLGRTTRILGLESADQASLNLGNGNDTVSTTGAAPLGRLSIVGGDGDNSIAGGVNSEVITGDAGSDTLQGGPGTDTLSGGAGSDRLIWNVGDGKDGLDGGADADIAVVNGGTSPVTIVASAVSAHTSVNVNGAGGPVFDNVESLLVNGTIGNDTLTGSFGDTLHGLQGNDSITGIDSARAFGDEGDDTLTAQSSGNHLDGGDGADSLSDFLSAGLNTLTGGNGADTISGVPRDVVDGGDGNDVLSGNSLVTILGGNGDDTITTASDAFVDGGDGADLINVQLARATLYGGAGDDTVQYRLRPISDDFCLIDGGTGFNFVNVFHDQQDDHDLGGWTVNLSGGSTSVLTEHHVEPPGEGVASPDHADLMLSLTNVTRLQISGDEHGDDVTIGNISASALQEVDVNVGGPSGADIVRDNITLSEAGSANVSLSSGDLVVAGSREKVVLQGLDSADKILIHSGAADDVVNLTGFNSSVPARQLTVDLGGGTNTLVSGTNTWVYQFNVGSGAHDTIQSWQGVLRGGHAHLDLRALPETSVSALLADHHIFMDGANTVITDGQGTFLTLVGVSINSLRPADFFF